MGARSTPCLQPPRLLPPSHAASFPETLPKGTMLARSPLLAREGSAGVRVPSSAHMHTKQMNSDQTCWYLFPEADTCLIHSACISSFLPRISGRACLPQWSVCLQNQVPAFAAYLRFLQGD